MPSGNGAELVAMVGLDALNGLREPLAHFVEEGDRVRNEVVGVDPKGVASSTAVNS